MPHASTLKTAINFLIKLIPFLHQFCLKIGNLLFRPKIRLEFRKLAIVFTATNNQEHHYNYPCFTLKNMTKRILYIKASHVTINKMTYHGALQFDNNFSRLNPKSTTHYIDCKNDIYKYYKENWGSIVENNGYIELKSFPTKLIFPVNPYKGSAHIFTDKKQKAKLFFPSNKIILTLEINDKLWEYGLSRKDVYESLINYLAYHCHMANQ